MISKLIGACFLATSTNALDFKGNNLDSLASDTVDNLMNYAGFSKGVVPEYESEELVESPTLKPKVNAIGYSKSSWGGSNSAQGFAIYSTADLGFAYELPLYNEDTFLVWRQRLHFYLGGRNYVTVGVGFAKLTIYLDVFAARLTALDNYMRYDVVNYGDFCQAM